MKKRLLLIMILVAACFLIGCSGAAKQNGSNDHKESQPEQESVEESEDIQKSASEEADTDVSIDSVNLEDASSNDQSNSKEDRLSAYPPDNIEYARVWLQMGGMKEVGELNVRHI